MSCCKDKTRVMLEYPVKYLNFVSYPTYCKHLDILVCHDKAEIMFPSIISGTKLQISILDCTSNTLVYNTSGKPVLATDVEPYRPYGVFFSPEIGGYVLKDYIINPPSVDGEPVLEEHKNEVPKKVVDKK